MPWANAQPIPIPVILPQQDALPAPAPAPAPTSVPAQEPVSEAQNFRQRWTLIAQSFRDMETNPDYAAYFLASKELRACQCSRPDPWAVLRGLDEGQPAGGGTDAQLRCGFCIVQKYAQWQERVSQQCGLMLVLSPFEIERLEKSEDASGLPKRCFERARSLHPVAASTAPAKTEAVLPPKVHGALVERKEAHRYVRVIAGPACVVSVEDAGLQFTSKDWLEIPPGLMQLKLKSTCQATVEVYRGAKAEFERVEPLSAGESSVLRWETK